MSSKVRLLFFVACAAAMVLGGLGYGLAESRSPDWLAAIPPVIAGFLIWMGDRVMRVYNRCQTRMIALFVVLSALWYFIPGLVYAFFADFLTEIDIFDNQFYLRSVFGSLVLFAAMLAGIGAAFFFNPNLARKEPAAPLRTPPLPYLCIVVLLVLTSVLAYRFQPELRIADVQNFLELYDPSVLSEANVFASLCVLWGILFAGAIREWFVNRRWLGLLASLPGLYFMKVLVIESGRRQVLFMILLMVLTVILCYAKRPGRLVISLGLAALTLFGTVGVVRNSLDPNQQKLTWQEMAISPFAELCQTTSMHARVLYVRESQSPLWGTTYLEDFPSMIPWSRFLFKENTKTPFYNEAIFQTLPWAERANFGMSASYQAEAYGNFGIFSPFFMVFFGYVLVRLLFLAPAPPRTVTGFMMFAYAIALVCWYVRSPLSTMLPQFRFFLGLALMHVVFQLIGRQRRPKLSLKEQIQKNEEEHLELLPKEVPALAQPGGPAAH